MKTGKLLYSSRLQLSSNTLCQTSIFCPKIQFIQNVDKNVDLKFCEVLNSAEKRVFLKIDFLDSKFNSGSVCSYHQVGSSFKKGVYSFAHKNCGIGAG